MESLIKGGGGGANLDLVLAEGGNHVTDVEGEVPGEVDELVEQEGADDENGVIREVGGHRVPRRLNKSRILGATLHSKQEREG